MTSLLVGLLTWIHGLGAVAWIGGSLFEFLVLFPLIGTLPGEAKKVAFVTTIRKLYIYYFVFGTLTIASGVLLFLALGAAVDFSKLWNVLIISGALLGLGVWVSARVSDWIINPRIIKAIEDRGSFPSSKQMAIGVGFFLVLLLIVFTLMITAALL